MPSEPPHIRSEQRIPHSFAALLGRSGRQSVVSCTVALRKSERGSRTGILLHLRTTARYFRSQRVAPLSSAKAFRSTPRGYQCRKYPFALETAPGEEPS